MDHCLHVWWDVKELVKMAASVAVAQENGCFQSLKAPSVTVAEASVFSPSGCWLRQVHFLPLVLSWR